MNMLRGGMAGLLVVVLGLASPSGAAADLSWPELVQRPDLWPVQCTMTKSVRLQRGNGFEAGQSVGVLELNAREVVVVSADGSTEYGANPDDTDVLAAANRIWNSLTEIERGLTYTALEQKPELWPYVVALTVPMAFQDGNRAEKGEKGVLIDFDRQRVQIRNDRLHTILQVPPQQTDLMARARENLVHPEAVRGRLVEELDGRMISSRTGLAAPFDAGAPPSLIVLVRASGTCGYTRQFLPKLLAFYKEVKPSHPEFEVVYVRADADVGAMQAFAAESGFSWRAVSMDTTDDLPVFARAFGSRLPQVLVMDRNGKLLADGVGDRASDTLARVRQLLGTRTAAR